jgi:RHS repeat-associated protein
LYQLAFEAGRILPKTNGGYQYEFDYKDHLGNLRLSFRESEGSPTNGVYPAPVIAQENAYYPFGLSHTGTDFSLNTPNQFQYNGKEKSASFGLNYSDYGFRTLDLLTNRFISVDPLADYNGQESWSTYQLTFNNPINNIDPDGRYVERDESEKRKRDSNQNDISSTHTDEFGKVLGIFNDGDLGVYMHTGAKNRGEIEAKRNKSGTTSGGGKYMGSTEYWDEFISPDSHKEEGRIIYNDPYGGWGQLIDWGNERSSNQDLLITYQESKSNQDLDIKMNTDWAPRPYGVMTGRLLNGKYATARSAGNYLAGMNGVTGTFQGKRISGNTYMRLAGAYQLRVLTVWNRFQIISFGKEFGSPPYYGESEYSGRRIQEGINAGNKKIKK